MNVDIRVPGPRDRGNVAAGSMQSSVGQEVGRILALLDELGLARKGDDGIWRKTRATLTTGDAESEAIDLFRQTTMGLGIESMDRWTREDRSISTLALSVSKQTFERLRDRSSLPPTNVE